MRWWPTSLRMRLTLWYAAALTIILLLYAGGVFAFVRHSFYGELDRQVNEDFEAAEELLRREGSAGLAAGTIQPWRDSDHHAHEDEGASHGSPRSGWRSSSRRRTRPRRGRPG